MQLKLAACSSVYMYAFLASYQFDNLENPVTCRKGTARTEGMRTQ